MITQTSDGRITELPILVLLPHNRCNCRCLMCDIWKIRQSREITKADLEPHLESLRSLRVRWLVLSGGEPLLHSDLWTLCKLLRPEVARISLLTAGLSLEREAEHVASMVDDVIVSIDGPPDIHDRIRGVSGAHQRLEGSLEALRRHRHEIPIHGRCTVQKLNCHALRRTVATSRCLGLNSLSFLAVDTTSSAFNRPPGWDPKLRVAAALDADDVERLSREIEALLEDCHGEIESGFIVERPEKLRRIVRYFRSQLGQLQATAPRCNAPWVSAVVEADGRVRPCFFHEPIGDIRRASLFDVLNGDEARSFRRNLDISTNPICRNCVCSLFLGASE